MPIRYFNSYSRQLEDFVPLEEGRVRLYTCGPTVYNFAHIGNFRAYIFEDLLQRHLEFRSFKVHRVMNLTDVDDKTIRGCRAAGIPLAVFTKPFKEAFFEDLKTLRIKPADQYPEATAADHIARMISMISTLEEKGHAYRADDGSVYFRIRSFPAYGRLAHIVLDELQAGVRVRSDEYEKENVGDFALWKAWDEADGDVGWESPWGRGRPGWHIECSAMATGILGPQLDIHCGGEDNIFPHHEAEIAQSECVTGLRFSKYWMHCKHLQVEGTKMAKSAGNFFTLRDLMDKGWSGREVRLALLSVKYREPLNFTMDGLAAARSALARLDEWSARLTETAGSAPPEPVSFPEMDAFGSALDDDLNISAALAAVFELIRETNRLLDGGNLAPGQAKSLADWLTGVHSVLALEPEAASLPAEVQALLGLRAQARASKDWKASDSIRDQIATLGWMVKDTKDGQKAIRL
ncbi:MAG: cysteine--tRNA ligase [Verrucomicrobiaceae bacterium]|nr:MAG: cysteine--tRNA ligase [Verrucomicrobiaceae bacterium]